jgi:ankyrin repeat protein
MLLAAARGHEAHSVTFILDALDECQLPDRRWLIDMLARFYTQISPSSSTTRRGRLKILVTSRPYFEGVQGFRCNARHQHLFHIAAEKENASLSSDVQLYIRQRLIDLSVSNLSREQICVVEEKLKLAHQHNFLCAFLLTEPLFEQPPGTMRQLLAVLDHAHMIDHIWGDYEDKDYVEKTDARAYEARRSILRILCDHPDIDISIKDNYGRTALHMVRYRRDGSEVHAARHLIEHGADRLAQDEDGMTPLHLAARAGDLLSLKVLVESPSDVMIEDTRGCNLLLCAARSGFEDVVQFLVDMCAGSSISLSADSQGRNALHHCLYDEKDFFLHPTPELVQTLLKAGVNANHRDQNGLDSLAWYASNLFLNAEVEIMGLLITHGADLKYKDQSGRNLAHLVMQCDVEFDLDVLLMLLKYGVDALAVDHDGRGILHHAAISGTVTVELLSYLSESLHLNIASLDAFGKSAFDCAKDTGREIAEKPWGSDIFRGNRWRGTEKAFLQHARESVSKTSFDIKFQCYETLVV